MAKTMLNSNSSRSHSIFNIRLVMAEACPSTEIFNKIRPIENDSKVNFLIYYNFLMLLIF